MVERNIDKKIRVLREILQASPSERLDNEGKSHPCTHLNTNAIKIPHKLLMYILNELKLTVSDDLQLPFYDNNGDVVGETDDYLLEVIIEDEDTKRLSILLKEYENKFPKRPKPLIREKTLELIAQKIGDLDTGFNLTKFLKNCGVDEELIIYPNTKWRMVFDALVYLSCSAKKEDELALSKVIGEATHPLMHGGDTSAANALREEYNNYLHYDNFGIAFDEKEGAYWALRQADKDEIDTILFEQQMELDEENEKQLKFFCKPNNKEKISLLRKAYQMLMNVVYAFCENPAHPTMELNEGYQFLHKLINITINELGLWRIKGTPFSRSEHFFRLPFSNLFSAEKVYQEQGRELSWQKIRPEMNAMYGDIEELYREVNGSDVLAEPDKQKKLNEIQLHLSTLKKKRGIAKKMQVHSKVQSTTPATKIEITKMPPLQFSNPLDSKLSQTKITPIDISKFVISVKDREIRVNGYLIGKPHAVGSNFEFFDYIRSQTPHIKINRNELPSKYGNLSIQEQVKNKSFIKILNGLGFKGEILKAFFYKRGRNTLIYRGDEITKEDLEKAGVKTSLFLKELELANIKNSPE